MGNVRWTADAVADLLDQFLAVTSELSATAWKAWSASVNGPAEGSVARHFDGETFTHVLNDFALENAQRDRTYTWAICPRGALHQVEPRWVGTVAEYERGECSSCIEHAARAAANEAERQRFQHEAALRHQLELDALPPFGVRFPRLVDCLADPADAERHIDRAMVVCHVCRIPFGYPFDPSERHDEIPVCQGYCARTNGQQPGSIILTQGGGDRVRFEADLAGALIERGFAISDQLGIVTPRGSYIVAVIKPDIVVLDPPVAIEIDLDREPNRHLTDEGVADDRRRDQVLQDLGWQVLRIRPPDAPAHGAWPWAIEARSQSLPGLTDRVVIALQQHAADLAERS